ncbi:MAG: PQQ-binding-like beta-propeller repeat protein [Acidobacteriota bacterium]|nr:PQQ-binding-like beta-propeller repeat protein [Acidobacteriota bacterium]
MLDLEVVSGGIIITVGSRAGLRVALCLVCVCILTAGLYAQTSVDWRVYNGSLSGDHYSKLNQINRKNVKQLKIAWTFDTGEKGGIQTNPLVIGGVLYAYTPTAKVIALNAATGQQIWRFDSGVKSTQPARGLAFWANGKQTRLFAGIMNFLYCLDAKTGEVIRSFGEDGRLDLRKGLRGNYEDQSIALTSPGTVYKDVIIVGGRNPETHPAPPGDIRAFDVHTGKLRWVFHTIPHPGEPGYETWPKDAWKTAGAANNWAGMTVDVQRGIVYVPTGSAVMDFYGGDRVGDGLYTDSELALDALTGKKLWYFQGVHHDVWDRDFPTAPVLFTMHRDGKEIPAIAQTSKQGFVFVFDRVTGKPLYPITERPYPKSIVAGEVTAPTQPLPDWPAPFARQRVTINDLTARTPEAHAWAVKKFNESISDGQFIPFRTDRDTLVFPGFDGGAEWGGPALDPKTNILYVNANEMAWLGRLVPAETGGSPGEQLFRQQCSVCHGINRAGSPPAMPSLIDVTKRLPEQKIVDTIHGGNGRMPAFPNVQGKQLESLLAFLRTEVKPEDDKKEMAAVVEPGVHDPEGKQVYQTYCAGCHGDNWKGQMAPPIPGLLGIEHRLTRAQVTEIVQKGSKTMIAFPDLKDKQLDALLHYLGVHEELPKVDSTPGIPQYDFAGYRKFLDPDGYPAVSTPWGTLTAINLNTGKMVWKIPFGTYPDLAAKGETKTGSENYGGPVVTAGGVLFIGATVYDRTFHAYDAATGKLLWEQQLPCAGVATPSTYEVNGRQYVVIAASGGRDPKSPTCGEYVAFALPK